jgi:hypothetical protein
MAKRSIAERLAQLEAQRKTLQTRLGKQERARDTRRKVLLGAFLLHRLDKGQDAVSRDQLAALVRRELPMFLTREDDLALFADLIGAPATAPLAARDGANSAPPQAPPQAPPASAHISNAAAPGEPSSVREAGASFAYPRNGDLGDR